MYEGEKQMGKFLQSCNLLLKWLTSKEEELIGHMAEIKRIEKPSATKIDLQKIDDDRRKQEKDQKDKTVAELDNSASIFKQNMNLTNHYLQDIYDLNQKDFNSEEEESEESELAQIKLELRFSNFQSSIPFMFQAVGESKEIWKEFEQSFRKISLKPTDMNFLKVYLTDRELVSYQDKCTVEINHIMQGYYECRLRNNAHPTFLKWLNKA